jgi:hypothetical protein
MLVKPPIQSQNALIMGLIGKGAEGLSSKNSKEGKGAGTKYLLEITVSRMFLVFGFGKHIKTFSCPVIPV